MSTEDLNPESAYGPRTGLNFGAFPAFPQDRRGGHERLRAQAVA